MFAFALASLLPLFLRELRFRHVMGPGLVTGLLLYAGFALQTVGLSVTSPQNSSFITALYVKLVPVVNFCVTGKIPLAVEILGLLLALVGLWLLTTQGSLHFHMGYGDLVTFACTICFASHIVALDRFSNTETFASVSVGQIFWVMVLSFASLWGIDRIDQDRTAPNHGPFLEPSWQLGVCQIYNGVLATGFAFTAIAWCMSHTTTTRTAFICTLEPVFAAISSFVYYKETMTWQKLLGAGLILAGILLGASHEIILKIKTSAVAVEEPAAVADKDLEGVATSRTFVESSSLNIPLMGINTQQSS